MSLRVLAANNSILVIGSLRVGIVSPIFVASISRALHEPCRDCIVPACILIVPVNGATPMPQPGYGYIQNSNLVHP